MRYVVPAIGGGLIAVLLLACAGRAGSQPDVLLAWHALLLGLALFSWLAAAPTGAGRRPAAGVSLALAALVLILVAGYAGASYAYAAWLTAVEFAAFLAVCLIAVRSGGWLLPRLPIALVAAGWLQTGLLLYQRFVLDDPRPAGSFLNPNHLAGWLGATVLFCAGRWIAAAADRRARLAWWASIPLLAGMVVTGSRGAWLGFAAGAAVLVLAGWARLGRSGRRVLLVGAIVLAMLGGAALALRMRQPDPYRYQRLNIWRASVMPLLEAPWTGTGPGQFSRASTELQFPDGRGVLRYDRGFRTTHSDWLRAAAELGWPGALALAWIVVAIGAHVARRGRDGRPVDPGALAALSALFAHAAFDNLTRAPAVYLLGAALLGLVIGVEGPGRRPVRPLWRWLLVAVVLHLFVAGEIAPWRSWRAGHGVGAEATMQRAEAAIAGTLDLARYGEARRLAEHAVAVAPNDASLRRRLARIEAAGVLALFPDLANRDRASRLFGDAEALDRTNPFVSMERAAFLLDTGDPVGARRAAERAIEIEPNAASPRLLLARAFLDAGQPERAARSLDEAESLAREHTAEAATGDYARDLLTLSPGLAEGLRERIDAARQPDPEDPRFAPEAVPGG